MAIPKPSNQSELCHLDTCLLTRSLSLSSHEISNSVHFVTKFSVPVSFSSVFWKAVNVARIYAGAAAAAALVELAFCVVFLTDEYPQQTASRNSFTKGTTKRSKGSDKKVRW